MYVSTNVNAKDWAIDQDRDASIASTGLMHHAFVKEYRSGFNNLVDPASSHTFVFEIKPCMQDASFCLLLKAHFTRRQ